MPGQFDKESTGKNFEWHRERLLREKRDPNAYSNNRIEYNIREIEKKHGAKAAREVAKEFNSRERNKGRKYFT
jgi:hypothetical protein